MRSENKMKVPGGRAETRDQRRLTTWSWSGRLIVAKIHKYVHLYLHFPRANVNVILNRATTRVTQQQQQQQQLNYERKKPW